MNKRNRPICTCVLQTQLNDTVWEHKSLQVLISGNLCLKVKHVSSFGLVLVTAQPLSVIPAFPPALLREWTANPKCQVPTGRTQEVQRLIPPTWWGTEEIAEQLWHQPSAWDTGWINKPLSAQTMGGWCEEKGGDQTKPYRFVKFSFQNTPENAPGALHQHCKQRLLKKLERGGSLLLPLSPSPPSLPFVLVRTALHNNDRAEN